VVASLSCFDGDVNNCNASERSSDPQLVVIEHTCVHTQHIIWLLDYIFSQV
jgi:hypothetical protein